MKYLIYGILAFVACALFLPKAGTTQIRNIPLLIAIILLIVGIVLYRFLKYVSLTMKAKKLLKKYGIKPIKTYFSPFAARFHGRYGIVFEHNGEIIDLMLISTKRKYQRYHFDSVYKLEFYRSNRVVFKSIKAKGGTVSNLVETKLVGKQSLSWEPSATVKVLLFDKLPEHISDSSRKEELGAGDKICASNVRVMDWTSFAKE